jgi:hypothetical protein
LNMVTREALAGCDSLLTENRRLLFALRRSLAE